MSAERAAPAAAQLRQVLEQPVFVDGANRAFGELTLEHARARAQELRAATGWGPTVRVAPVAAAWSQLAKEMQTRGAATVAELDPELVLSIAPKLWVLFPGAGVAPG
ncbi:MAG TPA: hypothetical protein VGX51_08985 [Solirubrobacteraceae bacterium]|jgi:hypothetical protein|nr:hypothetical protein [Solirubrobacteraceae bacterium]